MDDVGKAIFTGRNNSKLCEAEVLLVQGVGVGEVVRRLDVTSVTYYRWRKEYGGMKVDQAKRLKGFEKENARLKRLQTHVRTNPKTITMA